jgi:lipopolysaccharide/colanic/teichoic acid biosynthesis glycosyltransferase
VTGPAEDVRPDSRLRRLVDVGVGAVGLLVLAPLLLVLAVVVRCSSPGPVVFRQARVGRGGDDFTVWKFRSMVADPQGAAPAVSGRDDPRITPAGRFLRATRLDELPQLVNLVRGDMTLIGPRPEVRRFLPAYTAEELLLLRVRPGVVGPGAVLFAREQSHQLDVAVDPDAFYVEHHLHPKLALDLDYLRNRTLRRDLHLLGVAVRTVLVPSRPRAGAAPAPAPAQLRLPD